MGPQAVAWALRSIQVYLLFSPNFGYGRFKGAAGGLFRYSAYRQPTTCGHKSIHELQSLQSIPRTIPENESCHRRQVRVPGPALVAIALALIGAVIITASGLLERRTTTTGHTEPAPRTAKV